MAISSEITESLAQLCAKHQAKTNKYTKNHKRNTQLKPSRREKNKPLDLSLRVWRNNHSITDTQLLLKSCPSRRHVIHGVKVPKN